MGKFTTNYLLNSSFSVSCLKITYSICGFEQSVACHYDTELHTNLIECLIITGEFCLSNEETWFQAHHFVFSVQFFGLWEILATLFLAYHTLDCHSLHWHQTRRDLSVARAFLAIVSYARTTHYTIFNWNHRNSPPRHCGEFGRKLQCKRHRRNNGRKLRQQKSCNQRCVKGCIGHGGRLLHGDVLHVTAPSSVTAFVRTTNLICIWCSPSH